MNIFKFISKVSKNKNREKRKFLVAGILNVSITNLFLQIFLFSKLIDITLATFFSQVINTVFGYMIYGKYIFKVNSIRNFSLGKKYIILMIILWLLNSYGINYLSKLDFSSNFSAILMMPILASISYIGQKLWVFNK